MPTRIQTPDGPVDFPDGMKDADIEAVLQKQYGAPKAAPALLDARNSLQKSFDTNTKTSPNEPLLETGLKSVVGAIGAPFVHPLDAVKGFAHAVMPDSGGTGMAENLLGPLGPLLKHLVVGTGSQAKADYKEGGFPYAATKTLGSIGGGIALGGATGAGAGLLDDIIPQTSRAGARFASLSGDLADHPVPLKATLDPLQRATELGARGGTLPKAASDLLTRSQGLEPMTYPEIRDYHSNISDLSRDAQGSMNGKMLGQIGKVKSGLYADTMDALRPVGRADDFAAAMKEYRQAAQLKKLGKQAAIPIGATATGFAGKALYDAFK